MELLLTAIALGKPRRVGWISLQPNGSVSVGLSDKTFVSPDFKARNFLWNTYNRETLQYLVTSSPSTLTPVRNPHLSYHPPNWFHLKASGGKTLFEGIADLPIMLEQGGVVPWVRFISRPVSELTGAGLPRHPGRAKLLQVTAPPNECSIGLAIDFRSASSPAPAASYLLSESVNWNGYVLHVSAEALPPQIATLSWFHQR